ncbi:MAG: endonuclease/exonuclease/phosphatase family protein [Bacteroides sp.]|nr:endonuclease/exonuclease/phosphatase family protein [Bacteroides sp.]MCM1413682.1 endonuclease/exonuclease/phosphatase family protein [Bacteroides sp.]MCM1471861.1 endonuclease/exonuclease/phosphatase family protein [Bacteroides sp.]
MTPHAKKIWKRALTVVGLTGNTLLASVTIFSAYGGCIDPLKTCVGAVAAMLFPAFLILTLVVLVVNLIWFRRQAIVNGVSLLVCAGPILTLCPLNLFRPSEKSLEESDKPLLKIMTFNTLNFETYVDKRDTYEISASGNPTFEYILDQDADIVVCQESTDIATAELHGVTTRQHSMLMERYPYFDVTVRGMAILSKYPFDVVPVDFEDRYQLDLLRYDVHVGDRVLHLFSVHMQSIGLTSGDKEMYRELTEGESKSSMHEIRSTLLSKLNAAFRSRALQARDVKAAIEQVDGMTVLCGDFNDIPDSYACRTVESAGMTDAYREAGLGPCITYHADRLYFRIDHMFYRGPLKAERVWRGECTSSDHYPMVAIFELEQTKDKKQ